MAAAPVAAGVRRAERADVVAAAVARTVIGAADRVPRPTVGLVAGAARKGVPVWRRLPVDATTAADTPKVVRTVAGARPLHPALPLANARPGSTPRVVVAKRQVRGAAL